MTTEYGKWLRESLAQCGSITGLADALGIHRKRVYRWINGEADPSMREHLEAARYFAGLGVDSPPCPMDGVLAMAGDGHEGAVWYLRGVIDGGGRVGLARDVLRLEVSE